MKHTFKRLTALLLAVMVSASVLVPISASADAVDNSDNTTTETDVNVNGTNSFGNLLADQMEDSITDDSLENSSYGITDVVVENNIASVSYFADKDCTIVVALYDENNGEMLASGNADVLAAAERVDVTIDTDTMPKYFALKAFMIDSDNNPLSENYVSGTYTEAIQFVKNMEVSDFDSDSVLNLDEDETTNFAVFADGTKVVPYTDGYNIPENTSPDNGVYVFKNCNNDFKSLSVGDSISYTYGNEIILIKISSIKVDGDTVSITSVDNLEMEDFFDYVKIESKSTTSDVQYDSTGADDSVTFEGIVNKSEQQVNGIHSSGGFDVDDPKIEVDDDNVDFIQGFSLKFKIGEGKIQAGEEDEDILTASTELSADLEVSLNVDIKFYYNAPWNPIQAIQELKNAEIEFGADIEIGINGELKSKVSLNIPLGSFVISPIPGVYIDLTPHLKAEVQAAITFSATLTKHYGFKFSCNEGLCDTSTPAKLTFSVKVEGSIYIGIDFGPKMSLVSENLISTKLTLEAGGEVTSSMTEEIVPGADTKHDCVACLAGTVKAIVKFGVKVDILNKENLSKDADFSIEIKIADYYYSLDYDTSGYGKCPHISYKVKIAVNKNGTPVPGETVYIKKDGTYVELGTTDENGKLEVFLNNGTYSLRAGAFNDTLTVDDSSRLFNLEIGTLSGDDTDSNIDSDNGNLSDTTLSHEKETTKLVDSGTCGENVNWELYESGTLYIYGSGDMHDYVSSIFAPWYSYCSQISNVMIEPGVTNIGVYAFSYFGSLTSIEIPNSVTSIEYCAFAYCSSLTSVEIPNSVTSIGSHAFVSCYRLTSIEIPNSVTSIEDEAFYDCSSLTSIEIPDSVTSIGIEAFSGCSSLTSIEIPNSVTSIGIGAFFGCSSLTNIEIPNSVTDIGSSAFSGCSSLTNIEIPNSVTDIGSSEFYDCSSLTSIEIPDSVTSIGSYAFYVCSSLKDVYYTGTEEDWNCISIGGMNTCITNATIHYNCNAANSLSANSTASSLKNVVPLSSPSTVNVNSSNEDKFFVDDPVYNGEEMFVETETVIRITECMYSDLVPNGRYIFMIVRSDDVERLVASDNLIYIDQFTADDAGNLIFDCPASIGDDSIALIFGKKKTEVETPDTPTEDTESDTDTDTLTDSDVVSDTESNVDTATDTDSESTSDTDTATDSESASDTDTATDSESASDTDMATDTESASDTDTATDTESDIETGSSTGTIKFVDPWNSGSIYFHIWDASNPDYNTKYATKNGWAGNSWGSKKIKGTKVEGEDNVWESFEFEIPESHDVFVIFANEEGMQTYDCVINGNCFGDTARVTGEEVENPFDSEETAAVAVFDNNLDCGPYLQITSTGNIIGSCTAPNDDPATKVADYIWKMNGVQDKSGVDCVTPEKVQNALSAFGTDAESVWSKYQELYSSSEGYYDKQYDAKKILGIDTETDSDIDTPDTPDASYVEAIMGDIDGDGAVTLRDCYLIYKHCCGITGFELKDDIKKIIADVDGDGRIRGSDATQIQRYAMNLFCLNTVGKPIKINL